MVQFSEKPENTPMRILGNTIMAFIQFSQFYHIPFLTFSQGYGMTKVGYSVLTNVDNFGLCILPQPL